MVEPRLPCPVCFGVRMVKRSPPGAPQVVVDLCPRCGGIWFEHGEVQAVRRASGVPDPGDVDPSRAGRCTGCGAPVDRCDDACPACGQKVVIDCPTCDEPMEAVKHGDITLDLCTTCRGVWFDREELGHIWSAALARVQREKGRQGTASHSKALGGVDPAPALIDVLAFTPDLAVVAGEASLRGAAASLDVVLNAVPEVAGAVVDVSRAAFEILLEAVAAVLSGLSV